MWKFLKSGDNFLSQYFTVRNYETLGTELQEFCNFQYFWHITKFSLLGNLTVKIVTFEIKLILFQLGAYSPQKVYSAETVREVVEYARLRGVRVLPEFDAPAHVGNGWQWGEAEGKSVKETKEN